MADATSSTPRPGEEAGGQTATPNPTDGGSAPPEPSDNPNQPGAPPDAVTGADEAPCGPEPDPGPAGHAGHERAAAGQAGTAQPAPARRRPVDTLFVALLKLSRVFGRPVSEADVRASCPVPETGMTVGAFAQAAERLGYRVRRVPFGKRDVGALPTPFVLLGGPKTGALVVLASDSESLTLFSPVDGKVMAVPAGQAPLLGREALLIALDERDAGATGWRGMLSKRVKAVIWELMVASLIVNLIALATPLFVMTVYNKVIGQRALDTLGVLVIGITMLYTFDLLLRAIRGYISSHTGARMDALIGGEVIHRLVHLPYRHFETTPTGLISERLRQIETIRQFFTGQMPMVLVDLVFVFVFLAALYYLNTVIGHVVLAAIPLFLLISLVFHRAQRKLVEENFIALAAKTSALSETVANALTVKSLSLESEIEKRWGGRLALSAWTGFKTNNLANLTTVFGTVLQHLSGLIIIYMGAKLVIAGEMSIGALIAANILASRALAPMRQVVSAWSQLQEVRAAFGRLDEIMEVPTEATPGQLQPSAALTGDITLEKISFSYAPDLPPVVNDISLTIEKGSILCVMGPSGSGKSTLAKLMQGLYSPDAGRVLIDGTDIAHVSPHSLRRQMGVVPQEVQLFAGTVRENIAIGVTGVDHERIVTAAKFVGAHDFIQRLPKGYDTVLSERGGGLSAGQRQLLCIARALIRRPRIVILDEPSSALDSATEERLLRNLRRLAGSRTIIMITHRLAPAAIADKVAVLADGRLIAVGPPAEIAKKAREYMAGQRPEDDAAAAAQPMPGQQGSSAPPHNPPAAPETPAEGTGGTGAREAASGRIDGVG